MLLSVLELDMNEFYKLYDNDKINDAILYSKDLKDRYTVLWLYYVSGYSAFVRAVKKTQKSIDETNEALDINIVQGVKTAAMVAGEVAISVSESPVATPKFKTIGAIAKTFFRPGKRIASLKDAPKGNDENENM